MKQLILSLVLLVCGCGSALTSHAQTAPADSLAEKKMISTVGADMCRQLEQENAKKALNTLSADDAKQLFVRLMMSSASSSPELMSRITSDPANAQAYGEQVGRKIGIWLLKECPVSQPLFVRLAADKAGQQPAASPEEAKLVNTLSGEFCTAITPRLKELKGLSSEKRLKVVSTQLESSFKAHAKEIQQVYGANAMNDSASLRALGTKVGTQSAQQCPSIMAVFADVAK